jgi:hypothetical protein
VSVFAGNYVARTYTYAIDNGINQTVPASAGATYHAGGFFYVASADPVTGAAKSTMQIMFKNAAGNTMTTYTALSVDSNFVTDTWTYLSVTNGTGGTDLVAPAGTASITCQIYENAQGGGGGSVWFDNLYVTQTQAAAPPSFSIKTSVSGGQINISFPTVNGLTYDVLSTGDLKNQTSTWQTIGTVSGDGTVKSVSDTLGGAGRFYRVRAH